MVGALGAAALALSVAYFGALALALHPDYEGWRALFFERVLWWVYAPITLVMLYFYARVQLGRWLLVAGEADQARAWSEPRQRYSFWLRGRREALIHRLVLARACLHTIDYERARQALWHTEAPLPRRARELLDLGRWRAELALREDDLVEFGRIAQWVEEHDHDITDRAPDEVRAAWWAILAEGASRLGDDARVEEMTRRAELASAQGARADLSLALHVWRREDRARAEQACEALDRAMPAMNEQLPGRAVELLVARRDLVAWIDGEERERLMRDHEDRARELIARGQADARATFVFKERIGAAPEARSQEEEKET